jgi:hypothetical protein
VPSRLEEAFSSLSAEHQTILAAKYRDNHTDADTPAIPDCSVRKVTYLSHIARGNQQTPLKRPDLL